MCNTCFGQRSPFGQLISHCDETRIGARRPNQDNQINLYLLIVVIIVVVVFTLRAAFLHFFDRICCLGPWGGFFNWLWYWFGIFEWSPGSFSRIMVLYPHSQCILVSLPSPVVSLHSRLLRAFPNGYALCHLLLLLPLSCFLSLLLLSRLPVH